MSNHTPATIDALTDSECDAILRECKVMEIVDGFRLEPKVDIDLGRRIVRAGYAARVAAAEPGRRPTSDENARHAIDGAMAKGVVGIDPPPAGHWLGQYWDIGRRLASPPAAEPPREPTPAMIEAAAALPSAKVIDDVLGLHQIRTGATLPALEQSFIVTAWQAMYDASAAEAKEPK